MPRKTQPARFVDRPLAGRKKGSATAQEVLVTSIQASNPQQHEAGEAVKSAQHARVRKGVWG
jgi:hypothetical protein